jgi:hypothetical protein
LEIGQSAKPAEEARQSLAKDLIAAVDSIRLRTGAQ